MMNQNFSWRVIITPMKLRLFTLSIMFVVVSCIDKPLLPDRDPPYPQSETPTPIDSNQCEQTQDCAVGERCNQGECVTEVRIGPCLTINPDILDFGEVRRGETVVRNITISACEDQAIRLYDIQQGFTENESFNYSHSFLLPRTLNPGTSVVVQVEYTPRLAGTEFDELIINSDDPISSQRSIMITGTALPPNLEDIGLHIQLNWDKDLSDVDLHVVAPLGELNSCELDCHFRNRIPDWGDLGDTSDDPYLDDDDTDGFGPENINISEPKPGVYQVWAHHFSDHDVGNVSPTISIVSYGEELAVINLEQLRDDEVWFAAEIEIPSYQIQEINEVFTHEVSIDQCYEDEDFEEFP